MADWKKKIPKKFWHKDRQPKTSTVGGLIKILEELPKTLRLSEQVDVTVYNIDSKSRRQCRINEQW
jgi:hypothetical protein